MLDEIVELDLSLTLQKSSNGNIESGTEVPTATKQTGSVDIFLSLNCMNSKFTRNSRKESVNK